MQNQAASPVAALAKVEAQLDQHLVRREFPQDPDCVYLNTGSCSRKPTSVIAALNRGWQKLNHNPTILTFVDSEPSDLARRALSKLLDVDEKRILLTQNSTYGLQLLLNSFLREKGDELITTNTEHGSVAAISRLLAETRGVVTKRCEVDAFAGSKAFCQGLLNLVTSKTKVILVSEISSYNGWRPDLTSLFEETERAGIHLLVDGAHSPGQGLCRPGAHRLWLASCHKWLGGPNGTGVVVLAPDLVPDLKVVNMGDHHYDRLDANINDITRFESHGTSDVVRWYGVERACQLQDELGVDLMYRKQILLTQYLRDELERQFQPQFRTPDVFRTASGEASAMLVCHWPADRLKTKDLRDSLWTGWKLWTQPDFLNPTPGQGMRISCHVSTTKKEIDSLLDALSTLVK
jgi:selenocysteine lyase/cysteine desulfurase